MKKTIQLLVIIAAMFAGTRLNAQSMCCTADAGPDKTICCPGGGVFIGGTPSGSINCAGCDSIKYVWQPSLGLNNPNLAHPFASPTSTQTYTLCMVAYKSDTCTKMCCVACDVVVVNVNSFCCRMMSPGKEAIGKHASDIQLYPNPANADLTIDVSASLKDAEITIYDAVGRVVWQKKNVSDKNKYNVDVSTFPKGVYFVKAVMENTEVYNNKLLIE